jgi:hypothetical protein
MEGFFLAEEKRRVITSFCSKVIYWPNSKGDNSKKRRVYEAWSRASEWGGEGVCCG